MKKFINSYFIIILASFIFNACSKTPDIEPDLQNKFIVYPNPCEQFCNFSLINFGGVGYTLTIFNIDGKELTKIENPVSTVTLDLSNEPNGKYFALLTNGVNSYSLSFLKI